MIKPEEIQEILSLYQKHGWNLSRVLLSAELKKSLVEAGSEDIFGGIQVIDADINGVWFTRPSKHKRTAWELRHLSSNPFAVVAVFEENEEESVQEETRKELENRLKVHASNKLSNKKG